MLDFVDALTIGIPLITSPSVIALVFLGSLIGLVVGALPGLTSAMAVAIMIPLTYTLSPQEAFALLLPAYAAGTFGGSLGAILLNIPGTGAAIMTSLDGHPMCLRGEAGRAIGIAATSSLFGGLVSALFLAVAAPIAARWAIRLGAHEYFAVALFGLAVIAYIKPVLSSRDCWSGRSVYSSHVSATIPPGPIRASPSINAALIGGLTFVPVMIGLFGLAEVFRAIEQKVAARDPVRQQISGVAKSVLETIRMFPVLIRSILLGLFIGRDAGIRPNHRFRGWPMARKSVWVKTVTRWVPVPLKVSLRPRRPTTGGTGGALVPMIALGIPGDAVTAILIGALLIHGLKPGPALFIERPDLVSSLFLLFIMGNIPFRGHRTRGTAVHPETSGNAAPLPDAYRSNVLCHRCLCRAEQRLRHRRP